MKINRMVRLVGFVISAVALFASNGSLQAGQAGKSPVKVFILAGQSNMEGQGFISGKGKGTLETLVKDPESAPRYKHLVDKDGKWVVRDDVWASYGNKGKLTVGGFAGSDAIGPELGIGLVLGDYLDNQVLLLKIAVGGTSLDQNWRPPSSGGTVGWLYKAVLDAVKNLPKTIKTDFPEYDGKGFEIAGFCWHQGWQDGCAESMTRAYETNMVNFIKDIRKDLGIPNLPFVIGGSGFGGWAQKSPLRVMIRESQKAAASRPEFKGNVFYVETCQFFRPREVSPTGFGYHWNNNAETYYLIGDGMGKAMVELLGGPKAPVNPEDPTPKKEAKKKAPPREITVLKLKEMTLDLGNKVPLKLVQLPAGKFVMGSPANEVDRTGNEGPHRAVTIPKPFYMGVYEITVGQYVQFCKDTNREYARPEYSKRDDHPATGVSWDDAQAFCEWASRKTGKKVVLPTEAQWEYACRAGTTTRFFFGDDDEDMAAFGHYKFDGWDAAANNSTIIAPVGSFKSNQFGLYDVHGNVTEWCADLYAGDYTAQDQINPMDPAKKGSRVLRGGGWHKNPSGCRSAWRDKRGQGLSSTRDGFRVAVIEE